MWLWELEWSNNNFDVFIALNTFCLFKMPPFSVQKPGQKIQSYTLH